MFGQDLEHRALKPASACRAARSEAPRPPSSRADVIATAAAVSFCWISSEQRSPSAPSRSILFTKISVGIRAAQGAHQETGLRLDALDGRDNEHRAIEHAQYRSTSAMKSG